MKIDEVDIKIIKVLDTLEEKVSTTEIAKEIFEPDDRDELVKFDSKVRARLRKLKRYGLVGEEEENGKKAFYVFRDRVVSAQGEIYSKPMEEGLTRVRYKTDKMVVVLGENGYYIFAYVPFQGEIKGLRPHLS